MDYYGLLFLYYLKGLSGKSVLRLFFNVGAGGTEQLLPENTSTPTTTPILADIQYPDGLRTDQYFTYRETPTTVSNKARIKTIKGNTLVWNQVAPSMSSSLWVANRCTKTVSGNTLSLVGTGAAQNSFGVYISLPNLKLKVNHDYLFMCVVNPNRGTQIRFTFDSDVRYTTITPNRDNVYTRVVSTATEDPVVCYINHPSSITTSDTATIKNLMIVDLTMLNDSRITDYDSFRTYYPLDYYDNNAGTLLSFNGNGIKTVGFNQWDGETESGYIYNGTPYASNDYWRTKNYIPVIPNETYYFNVPSTSGQIALYDANKRYVSSVNSMGGSSHLVTIPNGCHFARFYQPASSDSSTVCVNISGDKNGTYEPYTSSTLSLPISTYFPTGMKSAGNVYDELSNKAITRIGTLNFDDFTWQYDSQHSMWVSTTGISDGTSTALLNANIPFNKIGIDGSDLGSRINSTYNIWLRNGSSSVEPSGEAYYELATPTETPITTEDANEALSLLMGRSVSSNNAKQMIDIITKGE